MKYVLVKVRINEECPIDDDVLENLSKDILDLVISPIEVALNMHEIAASIGVCCLDTDEEAIRESREREEEAHRRERREYEPEG